MTNEDHSPLTKLQKDFDIPMDTEVATPGTEQCQTHMVDTINNPGTYIMHKMTDLAKDTCNIYFK